MVALIGCAETGELLGMSHPVEVAAVYNHATNLARCAVHVLGSAVCDDVCAPFKRAAVDRCSECVVDNERHTVLVGDACKLLDVEHSATRVADCLAEHYLCVRAKCLLYLLLRCVRINVSALDAELLQRNAEEIVCSAVNLVGSYDMVASLADVEYSVEIGSLTRTGEHSANTALELRNLLCNSVVGRVLQACVEIALLLQVEEHSHLL